MTDVPGRRRGDPASSVGDERPTLDRCFYCGKETEAADLRTAPAAQPACRGCYGFALVLPGPRFLKKTVTKA